MVVISVPSRLKIATSLLLLCIPLIAAEVIVASRAPLWKLPYRSITYWSLAFTLICLPLSIWLATARRWAFPLAVLLSALWVIASIWVAVATQYPPLGFFALFLLGFSVLELSWLKFELGRSFFDPKLAWYQGLPKPIPGLNCQLGAGEKVLNLRVSRMDQDGVFLYSDTDAGKSFALLSSLLERRKLELILNFRERQVICEGAPIVSIAGGAGVGIQFLNSSADLKKEVSDFVEVLRGQGYV